MSWKCGNPECAIVRTLVFDAEDFDATKHDGETKTVIEYVCPVCKAAYGR